MNAIHRFDVAEVKPERTPDVEVHRLKEHGRQVNVLKDRKRKTYYRLSGLGLFLWQHFDGRRSVGDLADLVARAGGPPNVDVVGSAVLGLVRAGFAQAPQVPPANAVAVSSWKRLAGRCHAAMTWRWVWREADASIGASLARAGKVLSKPFALTLFALALTSGLGVFVALCQGGWFHAADAVSMGPIPILTLVLLAWAGGVVHECAHAMAIRRFGHEIVAVGFGWYWFGPCFFVDASDMWLAAPRKRIAVSLAGPLADLLLAAVSAWLCLFLPDSLALYAFIFSVNRLVTVLICLCPFIEGDGYCILMDALGRDNLRGRAMRWLLLDMRRSLRDMSALRAHWLDLTYGAGAIAYVIAMTAVTALMWHGWISIWLQQAYSADVVRALGWAVVAFAVTPLVLGLVGELERYTRVEKNA